ncbi:MAG: uracil-DNA glycosylase [Victivallaceae bacterium]|nr:uracil-DNA glycosylase [Victivallaceae bacterium]
MSTGTLLDAIPAPWRKVLPMAELTGRLTDLEQMLDAEQEAQVYPPREKIFTALAMVPPEKVRAVILGQDPYHKEHQAHGMAFSVPPDLQKLPPSLRNIFKEAAADLHWATPPPSGSLLPWAREGVLLLNTVLTVRAHEPGSHRKKGWEAFTDAVIKVLNERMEPVVFLLWGNDARAKRVLITESRHCVIESNHPSPLSASRGFFGSRPFSRTNAFLKEHARGEIDWNL